MKRNNIKKIIFKYFLHKPKIKNNLIYIKLKKNEY